MGTAPAIWNVILGAMVRVVPRSWWRSKAFSDGLAKFSEPMVAFTDPFVGETHAIRVDAAAKGTAVRVVRLVRHENILTRPASDWSVVRIYCHPGGRRRQYSRTLRLIGPS